MTKIIGWGYGWYCVNCGAKQDNNVKCEKCGSRRIRKCPNNSYGNPILPSRFMGGKNER